MLPKTPSFSLKGKRALITGASSGIGRACAVAMAEAGASVVCAARTAGPLNKTVDDMQEQGWDASALQLDQTNLDQLETAMREPFDIVINSAGMGRHKPALETTPEDYDAVMSLNLRSAYFLSKFAASAMKDNGVQGSIIHLSSQMGHVGGTDRTVYSASKHALEGMVKAMAIEWGELGIRINTICPTFIRTPLTRATLDDPKRAAWINDKIKLNRVGEVEDVMAAALYLASDAASLVTGTHMIIDGGWTAG
ncbi:3-oxoacyl-ACP reductase [Amylibacter marinus]|uniref:3-oxoacyl-ACP reductase n=2 Tax=Amylibacter marinus TaxID=1475483 RepID=A0ABQ5VYD9_9RHOB|nr:3-oxoacyl-ACP reductase [Amylibacter marinus]